MSAKPLNPAILDRHCRSQLFNDCECIQISLLPFLVTQSHRCLTTVRFPSFPLRNLRVVGAVTTKIPAVSHCPIPCAPCWPFHGKYSIFITIYLVCLFFSSLSHFLLMCHSYPCDRQFIRPFDDFSACGGTLRCLHGKDCIPHVFEFLFTAISASQSNGFLLWMAKCIAPRMHPHYHPFLDILIP
jgi:hypothetical protein